ncbi:hypothetical protein CVS40_9776 [Lucilia cuprina]|nr:hypothetical protein CVS40_9776 [Lucilia cuprina]
MISKYFLIFSVSHGQLMCYVCENCAQVTVETPQLECNEDYFNTGGSTDSSVQTTTEIPKTSPGITEDSDLTTKEETTPTTVTTEEPTTITTTETTTEKVTETTTEISTESTSEEIVETTHGSTTSTVAQPPTPPTVGPPMTTTGIPTPPNPGTVKPLDDVESLNNHSLAHEQNVDKDEVESVEVEHATTKTYKSSAEFRVRQLRSVSDVTYHCYKIHATTVNGTMVVNRGCSRVQTMESVCGQWEAQHPNEQVNKCYPCSRTKCNGSSALNVSITALIVAVVAVFIHRK